MTANMGTTDRILRLIAGIVLIALPFLPGLAAFDAGFLRWAALVVGVVMLLTALTRFCPAYTLLGIKTCKS
ncbi:DUF2892 domain-containing protein [Halovulum dunhuangense]|uniref:DUF2892 domain-containing protein n=1 Tax=Halovulum dunhuangense TaxID=1505036 RepID=A0A849L446_9RHOB|nr:DUF2892 domain-containing protein [Halovulum dunhuangense]NNU81126.1 DUF2892 domain-containing protein [Halovulum dunhuangense]